MKCPPRNTTVQLSTPYTDPQAIKLSIPKISKSKLSMFGFQTVRPAISATAGLLVISAASGKQSAVVAQVADDIEQV